MAKKFWGNILKYCTTQKLYLFLTFIGPRGVGVWSCFGSSTCKLKYIPNRSMFCLQQSLILLWKAWLAHFLSALESSNRDDTWPPRGGEEPASGCGGEAEKNMFPIGKWQRASRLCWHVCFKEFAIVNSVFGLALVKFQTLLLNTQLAIIRKQFFTFRKLEID